MRYPPRSLSPPEDPAVISFKHLVKTTFTDLSTPKRWLLRGSLLLLVGGLGAKALGGLADVEFFQGEWTWSSVQSGVGYIAGFLLGAVVRLFLKISLLAVALVGFIGWGMTQLGWVDGEMFTDFASAMGERAKEQATSFQEFIGGFLPASVMSGLGVASGVTQRPDMTPDND